MKLNQLFKKKIQPVIAVPKKPVISEQPVLMLGRLLAENVKSKTCIDSLAEVEFKAFSQFGDDGIIQWLVSKLAFESETFIEFGVQNYRESNTRFLMMNNNWSGFVMDGSEANVNQIITSEYYWKYELTAKAVFIDTANINSLLSSAGFGREIGILHIDLDGNDYWIWKAINVVSPTLVILEYNSVFGPDRAITVPYDPTFDRTQAHYSNLYFGASLPAMYELSREKGYTFIGCNSAGNNAYFVRKDKICEPVQEISLKEGYVLSKLRESRDRDGKMTCLGRGDRAEAIREMPVFNINTNLEEKF